MSLLLPDLLDLNARRSQPGTDVLSEDPLEILTPVPQWSYALWVDTTDIPQIDTSTQVAITVRFRVTAGRIGVGWMREHSDEFLIERHFAAGADKGTVLRIPGEALPGRLMFRNTSPAGRSRVTVIGIDARCEPRLPPPYPMTVARVEAPSSSDTPEQDHSVFEDPGAIAINQARLDFLDSLDLPVDNRRVLDAGCGVGHHTRFYTTRGCKVVGIDGRPENIQAMNRLYPDVEGVVGDLQEMELTPLGGFDIVHCFGLLYHLDSPLTALRRLARVCGELLVLETMVSDAAQPLMVLVDESASANQALGGLGCRPSPSFVAMALDRLGFAHVYGTSTPPRHSDFLFEWQGDLSVARRGHNLRCIFVASRAPLESPMLVDLLSSR